MKNNRNNSSNSSKKIVVKKKESKNSASSSSSENLVSLLRKERSKLTGSDEYIFEKVYNLCIDHIKWINIKGLQTQCVFQIPVFIPGVPLYNLTECAHYISRKLIKSGFSEANFNPPDKLFISWQ